MIAIPLEEKRREREQQRQADRLRHPSTARYSPTRHALLTAAAMIAGCDLPEATVTVSQDGTILCFDYTGRRHAVGDTRVAAQALGLQLEEHPAETPDGCAAVEFRAHDLLDGIYRVVRCVVPIPADWTDQR